MPGSFRRRGWELRGRRFGSKKTVIRAGAGIYYALIDNLSYRLDQNGPFNTVEAAKKATVAEIEGTGALPAALVIPSGVQPDLQTPTVISYDLKIEQQILPRHDAGRRLHRLARLS